MAASWPFEEFGQYLRAAMTAARVPDFAELSRLTGVSQTQFSNWRRGLARPSQESLRKVAVTLGVPPVKLFLAAGISSEDELNLSGQVDLTVLPKEIQEFLDLYANGGLSDEQQAYARRLVAHLTAGLRDEVASSQNKPAGRRRPA